MTMVLSERPLTDKLRTALNGDASADIRLARATALTCERFPRAK